MKKNKKKGLISAIALCGITLASSLAFTGCGSSDDDKKVELTNEQAYTLCRLAEFKIDVNMGNIANNLKIETLYKSDIDDFNGVSTDYFIKIEDGSRIFCSESPDEGGQYKIVCKDDSSEFGGYCMYYVHGTYPIMTKSYDTYYEAYVNAQEEGFFNEMSADDIINIEYLSDGAIKITFYIEKETDDSDGLTKETVYQNYTLNKDGNLIEKTEHYLYDYTSHTSYSWSNSAHETISRYIYGGVTATDISYIKNKIVEAKLSAN